MDEFDAMLPSSPVLTPPHYPPPFTLTRAAPGLLSTSPPNLNDV